jgi:hypothetical protein
MVTKDCSIAEKKIVQRRMKEAILKISLLCGLPRAVTALFSLYAIIPDDEIDEFGPRYDISALRPADRFLCLINR